MMERQWFIYVLSDNGEDFYVGRTYDTKRRQSQHRVRFGKQIVLRVVDSGFGKDAAKQSEIRWIEHLTRNAEHPANLMVGSSGHWQLSESTIAKLQEHGNRLWSDPQYVERQGAGLKRAREDPEFRKHRSESSRAMWQDPETRKRLLPRLLEMARRPWPEERKRALSEKTKGKDRNWSEEGKKRVQAVQFKPGHYKFSELPADVQEYHRAARRKQWDEIDHATRSKRATERNLEAWKRRTPEERKAISERINASKRAHLSAERIAEIARENGRKAGEKPGVKEKSSALFKGWWANLTPDAKAAFIAKRAPAIQAARQRNKLARKMGA